MLPAIYLTPESNLPIASANRGSAPTSPTKSHLKIVLVPLHRVPRLLLAPIFQDLPSLRSHSRPMSAYPLPVAFPSPTSKHLVVPQSSLAAEFWARAHLV